VGGEPLPNRVEFIGMAISLDRHPLTGEQRTLLHHDLTLVEEKLQDICVLMHACQGDDSQAAIRADETAAALQRLKWELERVLQTEHVAGAV
jgi:hypothetical protein